ncbi:hypothetical protein AAMO2058_000799600 [Amorphochlora amoebiformis]
MDAWFGLGLLLVAYEPGSSLTLRGQKSLRVKRMRNPSLVLSSGMHAYGDPRDGCLYEEEIMQIDTVMGDYCAPSCSNDPCPENLPQGVKAGPQCALFDSRSQKRFCVLTCTVQASSSKINECGINSSCKNASGVGVCTYDVFQKKKKKGGLLGKLG